MKKILMLVTAVLCTSVMVAQKNITKSQKRLTLVNYSENVDKPLTKKERIFIDEVYGEFADDYVYSNQNRLRELKNILRNRVILEEHPNKDLSSLTKLSSVQLLKAFNPSISRDFRISSENFNPLKYQFEFFSRRTDIQYYWVDNTQILISILPQHN